MKLLKRLKNKAKRVVNDTDEGYYVVAESKIDRKYPYQTRSYSRLTNAEKEKIPQNELDLIKSRDMMRQRQSMNSFGAVAFIGVLIFVAWFLEGTELQYQIFGKSIHKQRVEKEEVTMNNILWNY